MANFLFYSSFYTWLCHPNSGKAPKWLGVLILMGGIGFEGDCFIQFTFMDSEILSVLFSSLLVLAVMAEFWFAFWLLIKGWNNEAKV